ncbi:hypothetical protein EXIGLDRAFT_784753, partial [Exidia glandulosa HHB12029]
MSAASINATDRAQLSEEDGGADAARRSDPMDVDVVRGYDDSSYVGARAYSYDGGLEVLTWERRGARRGSQEGGAGGGGAAGAAGLAEGQDDAERAKEPTVGGTVAQQPVAPARSRAGGEREISHVQHGPQSEGNGQTGNQGLHIQGRHDMASAPAAGSRVWTIDGGITLEALAAARAAEDLPLQTDARISDGPQFSTLPDKVWLKPKHTKAGKRGVQLNEIEAQLSKPVADLAKTLTKGPRHFF